MKKKPMVLTRQSFADACDGERIYNLKAYDKVVYAALLREALQGDYSDVKPIKFGCWHFARTKPFSLDFVNGWGQRYEITLGRLADVEALAHWVDHLHSKIWFNCREVWDWNRRQPTMAPDREAPLNFFRAVVALTQRGLL